jgi:retron-type reverse transcriptase
VIEPIFEANFLDNSYGFRPRRSAQQAVKAVKKAGSTQICGVKTGLEANLS